MTAFFTSLTGRGAGVFTSWLDVVTTPRVVGSEPITREGLPGDPGNDDRDPNIDREELELALLRAQFHF